MRRLLLPLLLVFLCAALAYFKFYDEDLGQEAKGVSVSGRSTVRSAAPMENDRSSTEEYSDTMALVQSPQIDSTVRQASPRKYDGVRFPDGEVITVHLRERSPGFVIPNESSPDLIILDAYKLLIGVVEEHPNAAFKLYELQRHCRELMADKNGLGYADPNSYVGPWGLSYSPDGSGQQIAAIQLARVRHLDECRLLGERGFNDRDWLRSAADLGSSEANKELGSKLGRSAAAVEVFEQAWQAGEIYATSWLSHLYTNGFTTEDGQIVQDATQAFANQYLFASLLSFKYASHGGRNQMFARRAWEELQRMQNGLHPHELDEAYKIAKSLLHDECCLR